jgi:hypothetical protein
MLRSGCDCDFNLTNCLLNRQTIRATVIGYLFSIFMSECLDLNLQTQFCTLKDEGISILAFVRNFFKKMSEDQRYKAILKDYLSHDPFKIYKCYQNNPNSGDIFLNECKITCAISSPFSTITEFFSSFDCDLLNTVI